MSYFVPNYTCMQNLTRKGNTITAAVEIAVFMEDRIWVAYCPALEVSSYGDTKEEAQKALEEAMEIFFEETIERGTLEKVLLQLGWQLRQKPRALYLPPQIDLKRAAKFAVKKGFSHYNERLNIPVVI